MDKSNDSFIIFLKNYHSVLEDKLNENIVETVFNSLRRVKHESFNAKVDELIGVFKNVNLKNLSKIKNER
jgi:hypothetical protein